MKKQQLKKLTKLQRETQLKAGAARYDVHHLRYVITNMQHHRDRSARLGLTAEVEWAERALVGMRKTYNEHLARARELSAIMGWEPPK